MACKASDTKLLIQWLTALLYELRTVWKRALRSHRIPAGIVEEIAKFVGKYELIDNMWAFGHLQSVCFGTMARALHGNDRQFMLEPREQSIIFEVNEINKFYNK